MLPVAFIIENMDAPRLSPVVELNNVKTKFMGPQEGVCGLRTDQLRSMNTGIRFDKS